MTRISARVPYIVITPLGGNDLDGKFPPPPEAGSQLGRLGYELLALGDRQVCLCQIERRKKWRHFDLDAGAAPVASANAALQSACGGGEAWSVLLEPQVPVEQTGEGFPPIWLTYVWHRKFPAVPQHSGCNFQTKLFSVSPSLVRVFNLNYRWSPGRLSQSLPPNILLLLHWFPCPMYALSPGLIINKGNNTIYPQPRYVSLSSANYW